MFTVPDIEIVPSVLRWRSEVSGFETLREVKLVAEAEFFADLQNGGFAGAEHLSCLEHNGFIDILTDGHSRFPLEIPGQGTGGGKGVGGDLIKA